MTYNFDEIIPRENTDCVKFDLKKQLFGSDDVIPMWVADMDFKTPDFIVDAPKNPPSFVNWKGLWKTELSQYFKEYQPQDDDDIRKALQYVVAEAWVGSKYDELH